MADVDLRLERGSKPNNWRIVDAAGNPQSNYLAFFDALALIRVMRLQGGAAPLVQSRPHARGATLFLHDAEHHGAEVKIIESRGNGTCVVQFKVDGRTRVVPREALSARPREGVIRYRIVRTAGRREYVVEGVGYRDLRMLRGAFPYSRLEQVRGTA